MGVSQSAQNFKNEVLNVIDNQITDFSCLDVHLNAEPDLIDEDLGNGYTILHKIFNYDTKPKIELVQYLLDHKPNLDRRNSAGHIALMTAFQSELGQPFYKLLVKYGSDLDAIANNGQSAMQYARITKVEMNELKKIRKLYLKNPKAPRHEPLSNEDIEELDRIFLIDLAKLTYDMRKASKEAQKAKPKKAKPKTTKYNLSNEKKSTKVKKALPV